MKATQLGSVASILVSRWNAAVASRVPADQRDGAAAFVASWKELLECIADKSHALQRAG